jgi:hypothetical protein
MMDVSDPIANSQKQRRPLLAFATKGSGSNEEMRLKELVSRCDPEFIGFEKKRKLGSFLGLLKAFMRRPPSLIVMEGTGIAGGVACLLARLFIRHRYNVSSGDAVGPFVAAHVRILGIPFAIYERILCWFSSGFIGWTPYLVGRALTFGAPRGVTAPGWVIGKGIKDPVEERTKSRAQWGVPEDRIVFGLAGALVWNRRYQYCYGMELIKAIRQTSREDIAVVIIGEGSGHACLQEQAGNDLGSRIFLPGQVPLDNVMENLCGMDIASLPQSTDGVGAFRYTTKISEYQSANLPIVTSRIPAAYDLDLQPCWRLPGVAPWDPKYIAALSRLMSTVTLDDLARAKSEVKQGSVFSRESQIARVTSFLNDLREEI